jgi:hypothetical protein
MNEVREILAINMCFLDVTLDQMEHLDTRNHFHGWGIARLLGYAAELDNINRSQAAEEERRGNLKAECLSIAMDYIEAAKSRDIGLCEEIAFFLVEKTGDWARA